MNKYSLVLTALLTTLIVATSCKALKKPGGGFNLFTVQQDIDLGKQVKTEIESNKKDYPILPEASNRQAYIYIRKITNKLLSTGKVAYRKEFAWEVKIIDDDKTLNAFCTPGGYIYVYTGLIKYLDSEEQLAGVMGHEIAHAAQRHSTRQMTKIYGLQTMISVATGQADPGLLSQIALSVVSLKNSRAHEEEADSYSVVYMCPTSYEADGAADFFKKLEAQGGSRPPEFLSTHPNPGNRVANITKQAKERGCRGKSTYKSEYTKFKNSL
ncbi:MAG: putative Zn-dependent protease [Saprospiraceae bacterium]|jgi:predicted Zn-dependent protease